MANNEKLMIAKEVKFDEFYTEYKTISDELSHYRNHLKGKVIYLNCDDPSSSNFWKYFHNNFASLGLKKLISTHYVKDSEPSYKMEYTGGDDFNMDAGKITTIYGDGEYTAGDFRSKDCIDLLKQSDIVCTNPPFSLFGEYLAQLVEYKKSFIIIGSMDKANNKDIFPLIKDNKLWYGASIHSGGVDFRMPDDIDYYSDNVFQKDGHPYINLAGIRWYTNLDIEYRHEGLWHKNGEFDKTISHKYYYGNEDKYPEYFNYDGIDVNSASDIPIDYPGPMGVPISFLDKYNPDEFEIIGTGSDIKKKMIHTVTENKKTIAYVNEDGTIAWETPYTVSERKLGNGLRVKNEHGLPGKSPFIRIIIVNKNPISKMYDTGI